MLPFAKWTLYKGVASEAEPVTHEMDPVENLRRLARVEAMRAGDATVRDLHVLLALFRVAPEALDIVARSPQQTKLVRRIAEERKRVDALTPEPDPSLEVSEELETHFSRVSKELESWDGDLDRGRNLRAHVHLIRSILESPSDQLSDVLNRAEPTAAAEEETPPEPFGSTAEHLATLVGLLSAREAFQRVSPMVAASMMESVGGESLAQWNAHMRRQQAQVREKDARFLARLALTDSPQVYSVRIQSRYGLNALQARIFDLLCTFEIFGSPKHPSVRNLATSVDSEGYPRNLTEVVSAIQALMEIGLAVPRGDAGSFRTWDSFVLERPLAEELYQALAKDPLTDDDQQRFQNWIDTL